MNRGVMFGSASVLACILATAATGQTLPNAAPAPDERQATTGTPNGQDQTATDTAMGDIVVTAEKRGQTLQRTSATVVVLNSGQLLERGVTSLSQLTNQTTGVVFAPARQQLQIFSRGLGQADSQTQTTPSVEVDFDGANLPKAAQQAAFFDIDSVQFLKGPQGILYGRNAIGGAVQVTSRRPSLDGFHVDASIEGGNYDLVHPSVAVNIPLTGTLAVRTAVDYNRHTGYLTNGANSLDQVATRGSVLFKPTDKLSVLASINFFDRRGTGFSSIIQPYPDAANGNTRFVAPVPTAGVIGPVDFSNPYNSRGFDHSDGLLLSGQLDYTLVDGLTLTYNPTYFKYHSLQVNRYQVLTHDAATNRDIFGGYTVQLFQENSRDFSHEGRLRFERSGVDVIAGVAYHGFDGPDVVVRTAYPVGPAINGPYTATERNLGIFGDAKVGILDWLKVEGGVRYSRDRKGVYGTLSGFPVDLNADNFPAFTNVSWKAGLEAQVNSRILAYANVQTGYLPGSYQTATPTVLAGLGLSRRYQPVTLTGYTAGLKSRFWDDKIQLNLEGFYYDYRNFQVSQRAELITSGVQSFQTVFANVAKSRVYGLDADLTYHPYADGTLTLGVSLLSAKIVTTGFANLAVFQPSGVFAKVADPSLSGFTLPYSPKFTVNAGYQHIFHLGNMAQVIASVSTHHESSRWLEYTHPAIVGALQPSFFKTDASLTYRSPSSLWSIAAWARNLEDAATYSTLGPQPLRLNGTTTNPIIGYYTTTQRDVPRTFGGRVTLTY